MKNDLTKFELVSADPNDVTYRYEFTRDGALSLFLDYIISRDPERSWADTDWDSVTVSVYDADEPDDALITVDLREESEDD